MASKRFKAAITRAGTQAYIPIPFDPDEAWGVKERHYVAGSIEEHRFRGCIDSDVRPSVLPVGAAWLRDNDLGDGLDLEVVLAPDGHQVDTVSPDIAAALNSDPEARAFFESVAPFYRNNYIRAIESARRPETRARRIAEMMSMLKARQKQ